MSNCLRGVARLAVAWVVTLGGCWAEKPTAPSARPVATSSQSTVPNAAFDELLGLMRERLLVMHDVAKWKWNEDKPIADADREGQLLADLEQRGLAYGLSRERTRAFMAAQIEAGKLMQEADFAAWKDAGQGKFSEVRELTTDLRPRIDVLSNRLLAQLAMVSPAACDEARMNVLQRAEALIRGDGIDDNVRAVAIGPLFDSSAESAVEPALD